MKEKGFTLIELLAVIVILAIIALIATPVILNIIEDTRKTSTQESVNMYGKAVSNAIANKLINDPTYEIKEGEYTVSEDGKCLKLNSSSSNCDFVVNYDKEIKELNGIKINVLKNGVVNFNVEINNKNYSYPYKNGDGSCKLTGYTPYVDEAVCGNEEFYVIKITSNSVGLLSKWNITLPQSGYPTQSQTEAGIVNFTDEYGSSWDIDSGNPTSFVYDEVSKLHNYLVRYKEYLQTKQVQVSEITVPSYELIKGDFVETPSNYDPTLHSKLYLTNYWTGTGYQLGYLYCIKDNKISGCAANTQIGVRPLIYVPISETYVEN